VKELALGTAKKENDLVTVVGKLRNFPMNYRNFIESVLCFFLVRCSVPLVYSNSDLQAQDHMHRFAALEDSREYHQAAKEYAVVALRYPSSKYYQTEVWKAALLNIHPANQETDSDAALHLLQIYLTLDRKIEGRASTSQESA
jgi:hypothetical protein